ncbi:MAG: ATPase, T2SS/T4P/T4SS family [Elusimicrobiales bacterium]|nr:ATPase, T2SS/T4P/T4SS family [Elusimicrobiales bacterium]
MPNKIITFTGPKEGVGKTAVTINTAIAYAHLENRNVIIIPMDHLSRYEHDKMLGLSNVPSVVDILRILGRESITSAGMLLKGKIPFSNWGVGVLPLAKKRQDLLKLSPDIINGLLSKLSQNFDIFIDVDPYYPMQFFSFDISDLVFWVTNANANSLNATANIFRDINEMHFPLSRFEMIVNLYDMPGSLSPKDVEKFFKQMGKDVLAFMPWEDELPAMFNQNKVLIAENPNSQWIKILKIIISKIIELQPVEKSWSNSSSQAEFSHGSDLLWKPLERSGDIFGSSSTQAQVKQQSQVALPEWWEDLKMKVHKDVVTVLETERIKISDDPTQNQEVRKKVDSIINSLLQKETQYPLTREQRSRFISELIDEILGLGPLEELMRDSSVTEIMVNSPDKVYIEKSGKLIKTKYRFRDEEQIIQVIKRIVAPLGRRIDESVPLVDARLKDGSRVNAIIPPLAVSGPTLTIRRFSSKPFTDKDLISKGSISADMVEFIKLCVLLRKDIIIAGGTGTGKTTFLNMCSSYIPEDERIITVEDTAELKLQQDHWVRLESRPPNIEGKGEVTIRDLVKNCLRMRPDRIVVGEVRGAEALDMLQAMNTGHEGSLATIHANSPRDALTRLEAMCLMAGADLPIWALREMISSAVHMIVQLTRFSDGTRKVTSITEITGRDENKILTHEIFKYVQTGVDENGKVHGYFTATGEPPKFYPDFKTHGMDVPIEMFWTEEQKKQRMK